MTINTKISCYIRAQNEERKIADVIKSALQIADEIILVDSGSTDKTIEIAQSLGAKVYGQKWLGNGFQKRFGEEKASNDWVIDLDADEIISAELATEINAIFKDKIPDKNIYRMPLEIVPPFGKKWHKDTSSKRAKLYNKKFFRMPEHARWDQIQAPKGTEFGTLKNQIYHYAFADIAHQVTKLNSVSTKGANDTKLKPLPYLVLRIIFGMPFYTLRYYFNRKMWKCGLYGFAFSIVIAFGRWLRDVKMYEIYMSQNKE